MMVLLTSAYALNLLDRQIINVLAEPIKAELGLRDWQLGALTGLAFALLYSVAALPIARLADRGDRVRIVGAAILAWSVFTAACGFAGGFIQLLLLRVGVGVGEAGCAPPSQALIADRYPPEKRASALGVFALGSPIGAAIGLAAGGLLGEYVGWRATLIIVGLPGLAIGLLVLATLRDLRRDSPSIAPPALSTREVLHALAARRAFVLMALGAALLSFVNYGAMAFAGSFYLRVHGQDIADLGAALGMGPLAVIGVGMGLFGALAGAVGTLVGGVLGDRLGARDVRAYALIPASGSLLAVAAYGVMFSVPSGAWSLLLFMLPCFCVNLWNGPGTFALQNLAGSRARATAMAVVLLMTSGLGLGLGPLMVGALSDMLTPMLGAGEGLRLAILAGVSVGLLSAGCYALASRSLPADLARAAVDEA
jgi:MFS family permease